jgi:CRP-like cAMP-binding protein
MGGGASIEEHRGTVTTLLTGKPSDASDVTNLDQAKAEIRQLRAMALQVQEKLKDMSLNAANKEAHTGGGGKVKREAVMDRGGGGGTPAADYVPPVVEKSDNIKKLIMSIVTTNVLFASYAADEQAAIVDAFEKVECGIDQKVITQGESGDNFYIVECGGLDVLIKSSDGEKKTATLGPGTSFGELALMYNTPRAATVKVSDPCVLWQINRKTYREIVVYYKYKRNKEYMEFVKEVKIKDSKLVDLLKPDEIEKFTVSLDKEVYQPGDYIIRQGNVGDQFYIIADGNVEVYQSDGQGGENKLASLSKGAYFGEKALLSDDLRAASCVAEGGPVTVLSLGREDFNDMLGSFDELVNAKNNAAATPEAAPEASTTADGNKSYEIAAMSLDTLVVKATLGCGAFGRVKLCMYKENEEFYALKCQAKVAITESSLQEHVLNELRVMRRIDHPFIAKLFCALQDNRHIYFVLELLQGGELFTHLRNRGKLSEQTARFYSASVVYAFSTLHAKRIAYRDLKPENLVMDSNGYCKLVDFGLAKQLHSGKTWTLCGTPDYLAPEIILNEGHDLAVDYWALGVLIFEMVVGAPPFYAEDPMEVYEKILTGTPAMPTFFTRNLSDLIKKLLRSQQAKRLGNTRGGTAAVIKHKWFSTFDWQGLEKMDMKPPYKPAVVSKDDIANFDVFDEGEEPEVSDWSPDLANL